MSGWNVMSRSRERDEWWDGEDVADQARGQANKTIAAAATTGTVRALTLPRFFFLDFLSPSLTLLPPLVSTPTGFIIAPCPHAAHESGERERERESEVGATRASTEMAESTHYA